MPQKTTDPSNVIQGELGGHTLHAGGIGIVVLALVTIGAAVAGNLLQKEVFLHLERQKTVAAIFPAVLVDVGFCGILIVVEITSVAIILILNPFVSSIGGKQAHQVALNRHGCS